MSLAGFITWLATTPMSDALKAQAWIVPTIQTAHILAIAVLMGTVLVIDLRLVGLAERSQTVGHVARRYLPWFWGAFLVLLVTGTLMVIGEPARELQNPSFWLKMKLLALALLTTALFSVTIWRAQDWIDTSISARRVAVAGALALLVVWFAIIVVGRFIAYTIES